MDKEQTQKLIELYEHFSNLWDRHFPLSLACLPKKSFVVVVVVAVVVVVVVVVVVCRSWPLQIDDIVFALATPYS